MVTTYPAPLDSRVAALESAMATAQSDITSIQSVNTSQNTRLTNIESKNTSQDTAINGKQAKLTVTKLTNPRTAAIGAGSYLDFHSDWSASGKTIIGYCPRYAGNPHLVITRIFTSSGTVVFTVKNTHTSSITPAVNSMDVLVIYA